MYPAVYAEQKPDHPAVIMAGTGETVTFRELNERSNRFAHLLRDRGVQRGDHIAIFLENGPRYHEMCWGAQRAGIYYTTINYHLTVPEVEYIVNDCDARVLVTSSRLAPVATGLLDKMPNVHTRLVIDGPLDGYELFDDVVAAYPVTNIADESEGAAMLYSSGTTGKPKGIEPTLPEEAVGAYPGSVGLLLKVFFAGDESMVYLSPAPLYHSAPLHFTMSTHRLGGTTVVMERFDPHEALVAIERYKVTHSQWVPTMFVRTLKLPESERTGFDLSSHKVAIHAAAPCPVAIKEQMIDWWGPILYEYYAGTEGNGFTFIDANDWLKHKGSVGRSILGEIHILGDDGEELPTGEAGTIYFGNTTPPVYHNDPEKTQGAQNEKGWSTLWDMGYLDEEGYLYLTDRKAYMIISGGVNIYPQEAENVLVLHPKVVDCAVFGVPNTEFGEEVKAVVQPVDMADAGPELERELIAFCKEQLATFKCPKTVDFQAELPRLPTGKLYKRLLRDKYWEGHDSRVI
jgi:acyl-CoA synthetase (AMP-forming)/AMP-acid ligase II